MFRLPQIGKQKVKAMVTTCCNYWAILGGKYALIHFRCSFLEVDLDDMRPTNRLLEVLARDGTLRRHLPSAKSPIHYSVDSQKLISLSEMRHVVSNRNRTTCDNTDAVTSHRAFYEPTHNQEIAIDEMGGVGAFNDPMGR